MALCSLSAAAAAPSGSLPVIYISTANSTPVVSKDTYVQATYYLDPKGCEGVEALGSASAPLPLEIRGRGNYTWTSFDKKPYRLKLGKKAAMMGMPKSKHWALLAHADDTYGFMRNAVGFELSRLIGLPWTPGDAPVEVVLNGDYVGLYFLTETVRVASDRVDITDYDEEFDDFAGANPGMTLPWRDEYATGGWLIEIDNYYDTDQVTVTETGPDGQRTEMRLTYDSPSDHITTAHRQWLIDQWAQIDRLVYHSPDTDGACTWGELVDLTDLARFFIVNSLTDNYESFHGSCKIWRDRGQQSKWHFGPVWDFGSAFNRGAGQLLFEGDVWHNHLIPGMWEWREFRDTVAEVYARFRDGAFDGIYDYIDRYASHIATAARADRDRWSGKGYGCDDVEARAATVKQRLRDYARFYDRRFGVVPDDPSLPQTDIYLRGSFGNWDVDPACRFTELDDYVFTLDVKSLQGHFKLAGPDWNSGNVDFGGDASDAMDVAVGEPVQLTPRGCNLNMPSRVNDVTLRFDWATKTLTILPTAGTELPDCDADDAQAEYFNMQGIRVAEPVSGGIYIRRRGSRVDKVAL